MSSLLTLLERLQNIEDSEAQQHYRIPALWTGMDDPGTEAVVDGQAVPFFRTAIQAIMQAEDRTPARRRDGGEWTRHSIVYNMFTRLTTAWDHDGDGTISIDELPGGFRETGTFLKSIAILPYLHGLGVNTIHLLPVTAIGRDGNKGTLGSPYAIRNPYLLDERLAEPFHGLGVEAEFAAFVEAAHRLGMRVVMEFVFRTAAKDSDWIQEHPDWFYWIDESIPDRDPSSMAVEGYGSPRFNEEELNIIKMRVRRNDAAGLPPPGMAYRQMFQDPPDEVIREGDGYIGITDDGKRLRIPGAFADWPPDDIQPPWNDVTYLKLYDHPSFNYIAYNTIRMYDSRLAIAENENRGLWNTVLNIIPHYQKRFGIDGVMIDMGHALPRRLKQTMVERSRKNDPGFAFWEENFSISAKSRQEGYNAAVGYLWADQHLPAKLHEFLRLISDSDVPIPFFATAETHNTPRAAARPGGIRFSRLSFAINAFLPAVLFIHQGFELGETFPVNTGLGFTHDDLATLPSHTLPLFSHSALCWNNPEEFSDYVSRVISIRYRYTGMLTDPRARTTHVVDSGDSAVLCFIRCTQNGANALAIVANLDCHAARTAVLSLETPAAELSDLLTDERFASDKTRFTIALDAGQVRVFELHTESPAADA